MTLLKKSVSDLAGLRWNTSGSRVLSHNDALNLTMDRMKLAALNAYRINIPTLSAIAIKTTYHIALKFCFSIWRIGGFGKDRQ